MARTPKPSGRIKPKVFRCFSKTERNSANKRDGQRPNAHHPKFSDRGACTRDFRSTREGN